MDALCDVAVQLGVPIFGLAGTVHETVATRGRVEFIPEFYVDLDYNDDGTIFVNRTGSKHELDLIEQRVRTVVTDGTTVSTTGRFIPIRAESFCLHSDLPDAPQVTERVRATLASLEAA